MLVELKQQEHTDRFGRVSKHDVLCMKCDVCGKEWETRGSKARVISRKTHVCSHECKKRAHEHGGVIERQRAATCLKRYGTENPFSAEPCKAKMRDTWQTKYGVSHARNSELVKQKVKQTMLERFGEHPQQHPTIVQKRHKTMFERWGTINTWEIPHVREALISGSIAKFGVPFPMQNVELQKRVFEQRDGMTWMSKPEKAFRVLLEERYGKENVYVQQLIERKWSVDFYVKNIDTWVSFDGVYWHGLDRPIEEIRASSKPRNKAICSKWDKDRELDVYMASKGLHLVRITDEEFKSNPQTCILKVEHGASLHNTTRA